jgi:hypothetical protein
MFRVYLSRSKIHLISHLVSFREIGNPSGKQRRLSYQLIGGMGELKGEEREGGKNCSTHFFRLSTMDTVYKEACMAVVDCSA